MSRPESPGSTPGQDASAAAAAHGAPRGRLAPPDRAPRPWLEGYPPGVPTTYPYPGVPLPRILEDAARDFPDVVALDALGGRTTYLQLLDEADRLAGALAELGVGPGDRVAVVLPACPQHVVTLFAVWRLGAIVTEHDPDADADDLEVQLDAVRAGVVVCSDRRYDEIAGLRPPTVRHLVVTAVEHALPVHRRALRWWRTRVWDGTGRGGRAASGGLLRALRDPAAHRFRDLVEQGPARIDQTPVEALSAVAAVFPGQAGDDSLALTHAALLAAAFQARLWVPDVEAGAESLLVAEPLWRPYGLATGVLQGVLSAATLLCLPALSAADLVAVLRRRQPTMIFGDPALFALAAEAGEADLSGVRLCVSAGAPLDRGVADAIERRTGGKLREAWGLSRCGGLTHVNPVYGLAKPGTVGLPLPDVACALADPGDPRFPAPPGQPGELLVAGPQAMAGTWAAGADAPTPHHGWIRTGMRARVDADGYWTVLGALDAPG